MNRVAAALKRRALSLARRKTPPEAAEFGSLLAEVRKALDRENVLIRPPDSGERPGGLLELPDLPTVLFPDLHARPDFLSATLAWKPPKSAARGAGLNRSLRAAPSLAELLADGEATLVCLGDALHSEGPGASELWARAYSEYRSAWATSAFMDAEMAKALSGLELLLECKRAFPDAFHFLKGNHDNIVCEEGRGDHPFHKYAAEGEMVRSWFEFEYGTDLLESYRSFELALPIAARGTNFVASHAEPAFAVDAQAIREYRQRPDVVEALIWTANDEAAPQAVEASLEALLGDRARGARWYAGHRPVVGAYALRAGGRFVQFHAPGRRRLAYLRPGISLSPGATIIELPS